MLITHIRGLTILLITTHEPPSNAASVDLRGTQDNFLLLGGAFTARP